MSTVMEIEEAAAKLPIQDFSLPLQDLLDLATARATLLEIETGQETVSWLELKRDLDALQG